VPVSIYRIDRNYQIEPFQRGVMNATGLALDSEGTLFVSSRSDGIVYRITPDGNRIVQAEGMGVATGIAFDASGSLYVGDRSGSIFKVGSDGQIFVVATLEPSVAAYHLAFGPEGLIYVTGPTTTSFDAVYRINEHGEVTVFYRGLGRPQGLAFDIEGNLYVVASLHGRRGVVRITPEAEAELVIAGPNLVGLAFAPGNRLVLATSNGLYHMNWPIAGLPLQPK
jgi:sugar lactone lactonase YvrE